MDEQVLQVDFGRPVPLFPLPNFVLLPHATIPLHIFEPRYRAMTDDSLAASGAIAMATFEGDQWRRDYDGSPPLRPFVCVGCIDRYHRLEDGRYNLLLNGLCRARVVEEIDHDPYRQALLEPTETESAMDIDLDAERERIEGLLRDELLKTLKPVGQIRHWLAPTVATTAMIDVAIMTMSDNLEDKYQMLVEADAAVRAAWLERMLRDVRRTMSIAERLGPGQSPDGIHLN